MTQKESQEIMFAGSRIQDLNEFKTISLMIIFIFLGSVLAGITMTAAAITLGSAKIISTILLMFLFLITMLFVTYSIIITNKNLKTLYGKLHGDQGKQEKKAEQESDNEKNLRNKF